MYYEVQSWTEIPKQTKKKWKTTKATNEVRLSEEVFENNDDEDGYLGASGEVVISEFAF